MTDKTCCSLTVNTQVQDGVHFYWCEKCKRAGKGATADEAWTAFQSWKPAAARPKTAREFAGFVHARGGELRRIAAPFVFGESGLFERMMAKNAEYIASLTGEKYDAVWRTLEGAESYMKAYEEAIEIGASLPEMGSIVPYGSTVQLIPDVEAFRFACTTGGSSPFVWVNIEAYYLNDIPFMKWGKKNGDFFIELTGGPLDRGEIAGVAAYGERRGTGKIDGDFFPIKKLDEMAREYSKPYQNSMRDIDDFIKARGEGKTKTDANGREYLEKTIKGKGGKDDWTKKVYFDEIDCQYTSASGDKMYMKLAGKSFLGPYMKTRNSAAAVEEVQNRKRDEAEPADMVSSLITRSAEVLEKPIAEMSLAELAAASPSVNAEKAPIISAKKAEQATTKAPKEVKGDDGLF